MNKTDIQVLKAMVKTVSKKYANMRTGVKKVTSAGAIGMPLAVIIIYFAEMATDMKMPAEVSAAIGSLVTWLIGYAIPARIEAK